MLQQYHTFTPHLFHFASWNVVDISLSSSTFSRFVALLKQLINRRDHGVLLYADDNTVLLLPPVLPEVTARSTIPKSFGAYTSLSVSSQDIHSSSSAQLRVWNILDFPHQSHPSLFSDGGFFPVIFVSYLYCIVSFIEQIQEGLKSEIPSCCTNNLSFKTFVLSANECPNIFV